MLIFFHREIITLWLNIPLLWLLMALFIMIVLIRFYFWNCSLQIIIYYSLLHSFDLHIHSILKYFKRNKDRLCRRPKVHGNSKGMRKTRTNWTFFKGLEMGKRLCKVYHYLLCWTYIELWHKKNSCFDEIVPEFIRN